MKKLISFCALLLLCVGSLAWGTSAEKGGSTQRLVNINTANEATLEGLSGIGERKAEAIISYRKKQPFETVADLAKVPGISNKLLDKLTPSLTVG